MTKTLLRRPWVHLSLPVLATLIFVGATFAQEPNSEIPRPEGDAVRQGYSAHGQQWEQFKDTKVELEPDILQTQTAAQLPQQPRTAGPSPSAEASPGKSSSAPLPTDLSDAVQKGYSAHGEQWEQFKLTRVKLEPEILQARQREIQLRKAAAAPGILAATPTVDPDFIIFGYHPAYRDGLEYHYRWHALTHIGYSFVDFDAAGVINTTDWDARPMAFQAGGAAEANGVKVVFVLRNQAFNETILDTVMQSPALRTTLVGNVAAAVNSDSYCAGVNLDLEFNWGAATRDGITAFCAALNTALKALSPPRELSMYVNPTYSATRHDVAGLEPHLDYMLLSCYPWAGGWSGTVRAISDADNFVGQGNNYLNAGLPPRKLVLAISAYGHRWRTATIDYGAVITSSIGSMGFTDGLYDVTLQPDFGGPYPRNYMRTDETPWYGYNDGVSDRTHVYDDQESMDLKLRLAKSWRDAGGVNNGARLRGVGFWELGWMAEANSYDPITSTAVARTRTYGQIYQLCEEIFSPPGDVNYLFEKFEGPDDQKDFRWRDPNESPDTTGDTDNDSLRVLAAAPADVGLPPDTENAMHVFFDFENAAGNQLFFRHEILNDSNDTAVTDTNSAKAYVDTTSKFRAYLHVGESGYAGREVRMVLMDADGELERSAPYSLAAPGWQLLEWDLTAPGQINAYTTAEPAFSNGDAVLDSAGGGTRDIAFIGFLVAGGGIGSGTICLDELSYTHSNPGDLDYVINEFRYSDPDQEFVEIYGPAGALPAGFQLRLMDSTVGSATPIALSGTVPDDGGGFGFFVVGDPGVPNVDFSTGFAAGVDDIPNIDPSGLQLYNGTAGGVYDSVVYEAFGGLDDLVRQQTLGVTQNGYPWAGEVGPGSDISGRTYTLGRYPDGGNTFVNFDDFSFMPASPGVLNGSSIVMPFSTDFGAEPPRAFQTYQAFSVFGPPGAGLPLSPSGGNAYRCIDTTGGGVIGVIGDAALGAGGAGYSATGEIYIPAATGPVHAIAIGLCGRQGSTFFSTLGADSSGYESGYWLIYESTGGVALNDGRPDHPGVFEFVYATHDNMDDSPVLLLGSASLAVTGASDGAWTTFQLTVNPTAAVAADRLVARINGVDIYRGDIPSGGPTSGAFQIGFRENHAGAPAGQEGTWIDNLHITPAIVTAVDDWKFY